MPWFEYYQNNSGGFDILDDKVRKIVYIEAFDAESANLYAESIGIYFNGCEKEIDCECCGDRWYPVWSDDTGETFQDMINHLREWGRMIHPGKPDIILHHADGRKTRIHFAAAIDHITE